jgi:hypothetical protein
LQACDRVNRATRNSPQRVPRLGPTLPVEHRSGHEHLAARIGVKKQP